MPGMMSDDDWSAYRDRAAQQTANLNQAPFVLDPAALTGNQQANYTLMYGDTGGVNSLPKTISQAFMDYFGHDATPEDLAAWMGQAGRGTNAEDLRRMIAAAAQDPRNASVVTLGQAAPAAAAATVPAFSAGMMGQQGGIATIGGQPMFGAGMMGRVR